jgi:predicted transcriptional regulator
MAESTPSDRIPITIEITPEQKQSLERLAEQQGVSFEDAVRAAIEHEIAVSSANGDGTPEAEPGSFLDGLEHLVGSVEGPLISRRIPIT